MLMRRIASRSLRANSKWLRTSLPVHASNQLRAFSTEKEEAEDEFNPPGLAEGVKPKIISVSRKGLLKTDNRKMDEATLDALSPLAKEIMLTISVRGPIPFSDWMRLCLGHPEHGYYMKETVFGEDGDFVTSPELSSLFGELMAIWAIRQWELLGSPKKFRVVECGPGRGTLMKDFLRVSRRFRTFWNALKCVHLVENSPKMRAEQRQSLAVQDLHQKPEVATEMPEVELHADIDPDVVDALPDASHSRPVDEGGRTQYRELVSWHWQFADVPEDMPVIVIANEFLDALPVHQFKYTDDRGWREVMVDVDLAENAVNPFRYVLSGSPAVSNYIPQELTPRPPSEHPCADSLEMSPVSQQVVQTVAQKLRKTGGCALFIDYGSDNHISRSLQAVKAHKYVDVLEDPGACDITGHVDFQSLREAVERLPPAKEDEKDLLVSPVVRQKILLRELGIAERLKASLEKIEREEEQMKVALAVQRLVDDEEPTGMGELFKCMAIYEKGMATPTGFYKDE